MLRKLLKCEYRYWATAPWFYTLLFSFVYLFMAFSNGMNHYNNNALTYFAFPLLIFLGTLIAVVNWKREQQYGGTTTALTMPVTRREYLVSKYVSVFLGQLMFSLIVVLSSTILLVLVSGNHYWQTVSAATITFSMIILGGTINFHSELMNKPLNIYVVSGVLLVVYHFVYYFVYYFTTPAWDGYYFPPLLVVAGIACALIVSGPLMTWWISLGYISRVEDIP